MTASLSAREGLVGRHMGALAVVQTTGQSFGPRVGRLVLDGVADSPLPGMMVGSVALLTTIGCGAVGWRLPPGTGRDGKSRESP